MSSNSLSSYLIAESLQQSAVWEDFLQQVGVRTKRQNGVLWQHKTTPLPGVDYWYSTRCALSEDWQIPASAAFLRIEPRDTYSSFQVQKLAAKRGWQVISVSSQQPPQTAVISIAPEFDQLPPLWKRKHRYNLTLAERADLTVEVVEQFSEASFARFMALHHATADRHTFRSHPDSYYRTQLESLMPSGSLKLILISYQGVDIDGLVMSLHAGVAATLHGGSAPIERQRQSAYLLEATAIRVAQAAGCEWLDCWGVNAIFDATKQEWQPSENPASLGATRFKLGFAPEVHTYPGCFDVILRPAAYSLYQAALRAKGGKKTSGFFA